MSRSLSALSSLPLLLALCLAPVACDRGGEGTKNPDGGGGGGGGPAETKVVQDPDPAELASLRASFLKGDYEGVISSGNALAATLTAPTQQRSLAKTQAWLALAHVGTNLPENGKDGLTAAVATAGSLQDAELTALVELAQGAYMVATGDEAGAMSHLKAASSGPDGGLAMLMEGQGHIGLAFDDEDALTDPSQLDAAAKSYQAAHDAASDPLIKARALVGLAGVANYKKDKAKVCEHAKAASALYQSGAATGSLTEVTTLLIGDNGCG